MAKKRKDDLSSLVEKTVVAEVEEPQVIDPVVEVHPDEFFDTKSAELDIIALISPYVDPTDTIAVRVDGDNYH
jgi:hypothetical protein